MSTAETAIAAIPAWPSWRDSTCMRAQAAGGESASAPSTMPASVLSTTCAAAGWQYV